MSSSPWEKPYFTPFINEVMDSVGFKVYAKLFFSPFYHEQHMVWTNLYAETEPDREPYWTNVPASPHECFERWLSICQSSGPAFEECMWVEERRADGKAVFHVLMANWCSRLPYDFVRTSWKKVSGCLGRAGEPDKRIRGLLRHLVMMRHMPMEIRCGEYGQLSEFNGRYTYYDFKPSAF